MRGVHYSACSLCYKEIAQFHQKCSLMRDCSLFRRLLLPEYTVLSLKLTNYLGKKISSGKEDLRNLALVYQTFPFVLKDIEKETKNLQVRIEL